MDQEQCVYVKASVLQELERDKRGLKWQLSRAAKAAESRSADLCASEAKVKDLLTIVEMNKNVADRAVKRAYTQEAQMRRLSTERDVLYQRLMNQRQRYQEKGLEELRNRRHRRWKREVFQVFASVTRRERWQKVCLHRLVTRIRRYKLRMSLANWKYHITSVLVFTWQHQSCRNGIANMPTSASTVVFPAGLDYTEYMYDECFRLRFKRRWELKRLSFSAWKAHWTLYTNQARLAARFSRLKLLRYVWRRWSAYYHRKNWSRTLVEQATQRRLQTRFRIWACKTRIQSQRRRYLIRILRRKRLVVLRFLFTRLRLKCIERCTLEWAEVLRSAQHALEEEKVLYSIHQNTAIQDLHDSYLSQQQQQERFREVQVQRFEDLRRLEIKRHCFGLLRWRSIRRRYQESLAIRFGRLQHWQRVVRRHYTAWKLYVTRHVAVRRLKHQNIVRRKKLTIQQSFKAMIAVIHRERQRRMYLRSWVGKRRRSLLVRGFWAWKLAFGIEEALTHGHCEVHLLTQRIQDQEFRWQHELVRANKIRVQYQLQCTLALIDRKRAHWLRQVFAAWATCSRRNTRRRRILHKYIKKQSLYIVQYGLRVWQQVHVQRKYVRSQIQHQHDLYQRRNLWHLFTRWRKYIHRKTKLHWNLERQLLYFRLWWLSYRARKRRAIAFHRFLHRQIRLGWQRQAFWRWHNRHNEICQVEDRFCVRQTELVTRTWMRWQHYTKLRLRLQNRQLSYSRARLVHLLRMHVKATTFQCWKRYWSHLRLQKDFVDRFLTILTLRRNRNTVLKRLFDEWHQGSMKSIRQRILLSKIFRSCLQRIIKITWVRWVVFARQKSISLAMLSRSFSQMGIMVCRISKRYLVGSTFSVWRHHVNMAKKIRYLYGKFTKCRQLRTLLICFSTWKYNYQQQQHLNLSLQRTLNQLRNGFLRISFHHWERWIQQKHFYDLNASHQQLSLQSQQRFFSWSSALESKQCLKHYVTAWRAAIIRKKAVRLALTNVMNAKTRLHQQCVWNKWVWQSRMYKRLLALVAKCEKRLKIAVWARMKQHYFTQKQFIQGIASLIKIWQRSSLRWHWSQWKRVDRLIWEWKVIKSEKKSTKLLQAFMDRAMTLRQKKVYLTAILRAWATHTRRQKRVRRSVAHTIGRMLQDSTRTHFNNWKGMVDRHRWCRTALNRVIKRFITHHVRAAFHQWRYYNMGAVFADKVANADQKFARYRSLSAKHIAMSMYISWKHPCLSSCFTHWKFAVIERQNKRNLIITHGVAKSMHRKLFRTFLAWRYHVQAKKSISAIFTAKRIQQHHKCLKEAFLKWQRDTRGRSQMMYWLTRLVTIHQLWHMRRAISMLRSNQQEIARRQSMMVVISAQNALRKQKQDNLIHNMARTLQRKNHMTLSETLLHWKYFYNTRRKTKMMITLAQGRWKRRWLRTILLLWHCVALDEIVMRQKVRKWKSLCTYRAMKWWWSAWISYIKKVSATKQFVYDRIIASKFQAQLQDAWAKWRSFVQFTNREIEVERNERWHELLRLCTHQKESLEAKNEGLLLETIHLKKCTAERQRRLLSIFCKYAQTIVVSSSLGAASRVNHAFTIWKQKLSLAHLLLRISQKLCFRLYLHVFQRWKSIVIGVRQRTQLKQAKMVIMERIIRVIHSSSALTRKRKTMLEWKSLIIRRRAKKALAFHILTARNKDSKLILRSYWRNWKALARQRRMQLRQLNAMHHRVNVNVIHQAYWRWVRWHHTFHVQKMGIVTLSRVWMALQRRILLQSWLRWRNYIVKKMVIDALANDITLNRLQIDAIQLHERQKLLLLNFLHWKTHTDIIQSAREQRRIAHVLVWNRHCTKVCFLAWKKQVSSRQRFLFPVLCIQTTIRGQTNQERQLYCAYNEYRRKLQTRWRLIQTNSHIKQRIRQICALSWLLRSLRRQHTRIQKCALWIWFTQVQSMSWGLKKLPLLRSHLQADITAQVALLALREFHLLQQSFVWAQHAKTCHMLAIIHRYCVRLHLRRAFDRVQTHRKYRHQGLWEMSLHHITKRRVALGKAFVEQLTHVLLRSSFSIWKAQYIAYAIKEAEAAQLDLLTALQNASCYRHTLDLYLMQ